MLPFASMNCVNMSKIQMQKGKAEFTRNWLHAWTRVERYSHFGKRFWQILLREKLVRYFTYNNRFLSNLPLIIDRHTETLLPEICQRERHGSIILQLLNMINKTVALHILNMIKPYLFFYIFQVAMSQCVDVP